MMMKWEKDGTVFAIASGRNMKGGNYNCKKIGEKKTNLVTLDVAVSEFGSENSEFLQVKCWGPHANAGYGVKEGENIFVAGKIETREYNGKEYTSLNASFVGRERPVSIDGQPQEKSEQKKQEAPAAESGDFVEISPDEDLPF